MSRSASTDTTPNPSTRFFQWDSDNKCFKYYDKEAISENGKKGTNILVQLPFQFLVLDQLHTIKGFSDEEKAGIYSNEVRDLRTQVLKIKVGKHDALQGLYQDIKNKVVGSKYAASVYIAYFNDKKELSIGNISFVGSSLSAWIEFCKNNKPTEGAIKVAATKFIEKNKKVNWNEPVFTANTVKPETDAMAIELDKTLQIYLKEYFEYSKPVTETASTETVIKKTFQPETDFIMDNSPKASLIVNSKASDTFDDLPF